MRNKKIWLIAGLAAVFLFAAAGIALSTNQKEPISRNQVETIVSEQYGGSVTKMELERENGSPVYAIDLTNKQGKYRMMMDAASGDVLSLTRSQSVPADSPVKLSAEDAGAIAAKETGGTVAKVETKSEHNQHYYLVSLNTPKGAATVKIDRSSGKVFEKKDEPVKKDPPPKTVISQDEARTIALKKLNGQVTGITLEENKGQHEYRVTIESDDEEASVFVNAYTGAASISWESDDEEDDDDEDEDNDRGDDDAEEESDQDDDQDKDSEDDKD